MENVMRDDAKLFGRYMDDVIWFISGEHVESKLTELKTYAQGINTKVAELENNVVKNDINELDIIFVVAMTWFN